MWGTFRAFNGLGRSSVVRHGGEYKFPNGENTAGIVYTEMLLQICRDYPALPDPRTLTVNEVRFFYEGLRSELEKHTEPKG